MDRKNVRSLAALAAVILIFVLLKLLGVIQWPWLWVLSPLWVCLALLLLGLLAFGIISLVKKDR